MIEDLRKGLCASCSCTEEAGPDDKVGLISIREAINVVGQEGVSPEDYLEACIFLVDHREELHQRVFVSLPSEDSEMGEIVRGGSEGRCLCGHERVIIPINSRTEFEAGATSCVITQDNPVCLKPIGGDKASTFLRLDIEKDCHGQEAVVIRHDPFAPRVITEDIIRDASGIDNNGFYLKELAQILLKEPKPPYFYIEFAGVKVPIFSFNEVGVSASTVTITPDIAVEVFSPNDLAD